jgi:hypothetical protein
VNSSKLGIRHLKGAAFSQTAGVTVKNGRLSLAPKKSGQVAIFYAQTLELEKVQKQYCQISIGTIYQNGENYIK